MTSWPIFRRLILRPLAAEPLRTALTLFAVTLGVAVVIAIDLAGDAAAGSFRSSMETLAGKAPLEIAATGGVKEDLLAQLVRLPQPYRFEPRIEDYAVIAETGTTVPLIGLDFLSQEPQEDADGSPDDLLDPRSVWVSSSLAHQRDDRLRLTINDSTAEYIVRGQFDGRDPFLVMDLYGAKIATGKAGRFDRIEVYLPETGEPADWELRLANELPGGVELRPHGARTDQNRRMLAAFRWNLRVLSYISLVVGAFLIYNTIAVSVVRRRSEIGVLRALGATRGQVMLLFLAEAAFFGLFGAAAGLVAGRAMASGAVELLARTVESLYVSSRPGELAFTAGTLVEALVVGLGVALAAAFAPAREASRVPPVEAMARGQREYHARLHVWRDLALAAAVALAGIVAAMQPAIDGRPVFGYAACFLFILAAALAIPALVTVTARLTASLAHRVLGVEGLLAARSIAASLSRTSVLVGALSTAIAMMISVGIMVGSFRETVALWMEDQLQADFYLRPAGGGAAGRYPTLAAGVADTIERLEEVRVVDRFRVHEITFGGAPALLGAGQTEVIRQFRRTNFLPGHDRDAILERLPQGDYCIVSEPFANKHDVRAGSRIVLPIGDAGHTFEVLGVYHDYSNERGYVIVDRQTLLRFLPDPSPSSLAVYAKAGADLATLRASLESAVAGRNLVIFSNRSLREEALRIFDRTFAITWALEAVAILVAVLGIAGALLALVIDRRREIGVLRFLGAARPQIRKLILAEAGLLGLLANAAGFALGYVLSLVLIYVINVQSFGWTIQFHWPVTLLWTALSAIYLSTVLAALYPARVAQRLNPIEVIHEE